MYAQYLPNVSPMSAQCLPNVPYVCPMSFAVKSRISSDMFYFYQVGAEYSEERENSKSAT